MTSQQTSNLQTLNLQKNTTSFNLLMEGYDFFDIDKAIEYQVLKSDGEINTDFFSKRIMFLKKEMYHKKFEIYSGHKSPVMGSGNEFLVVDLYDRKFKLKLKKVVSEEPKKEVVVEEPKKAVDVIEPKNNNSNSNMVCEKYFKTFNLIPNMKEPTSEWSLKKPNTNLWKNENIEQLMNFEDPKSKGIPCGKRNNIVVIDLDFYDKYDKKGKLKSAFNKEDNIFIKQFGDIEKCKEIFKDHLVVETARGGLHLYFNYDPSIKTTSNSLLGIDIRSDGGYVVSMGTQINKAKYDGRLKGKTEEEKKGFYKVVNNKPIQNIPIELAVFLKENMWRNKRQISKPIKRKTNGESDVAINPYEQDQIDLTAYNYDISDDNLRKILDGLPDKYFTNNIEWIIFSTAMMTLDKRELWEEYSKARGGDTYDKESNDKKWDYQVFKYKTFLCIENLLCNSTFIVGDEEDELIKKELASLYLAYYKYKPTDCHNEKPDLVLEDRRYLDKNNDGEFLTTHNGHIICKSATGTGKTTATKNYIQKTEKRFISIVSRVTLGEEQVAVFKDAGIDCHWHDDITNPPYEMEEKKCNQFCNDAHGWWMYEGENVVVTIDSIIKMTNWEDFSDYVLYLDEFNSLVEYFIDCPNLDNKRVLVKQFLIKMMKECDRIIGTDADISDNSLLFLKQNDIDYTFIENKYQHNLTKDGDVIVAQELYSYDELIGNIKSLEKFMVCCDSKLSAIKIHSDLIQLGFDKKDMVCITSDTTERINLDDYPIVIFSPKIVYGLDSVMEREVFAFMKGHTISPTAMVQQIARCRNIKKLSFLFSMKNWKPYKWEDVEECKDCLENGMRLFKSQGMTNNANDNKLEKDYNELYTNFQYTKDCYETNKFAHFLKILKHKGYDVKYEHKKSKGVGNQIAKEYKGEKITAFMEAVINCIGLNKWAKIEYDEKHLINPETGEKEPFDEYDILKKNMPPQWEKIIRLLNVPLDKCGDFCDIITCEKELEKYFNRVRFFIRDHEYIKTLNNKNDFDIKKYTSGINKTIFINKLLDGMGMKDLMDFKVQSVLTAHDQEKLFIEYKHIFGRYRGKGNPFESVKGCKSILIKSYKDMFSKDIIITHSTTKINKKTKKTEKVYTYSINDEMIKNTEILFELKNE